MVIVCRVLCGWVYPCQFLSLSHQPNSPQVGIKCFGHYTVALISAIQAVQLHENKYSKRK